METLKTSETLNEGLVASNQDEKRNQFGGTFPQPFNLGKMKCVESAFASVAETQNVDSYKVNANNSSGHGDVPIKGISLFVELTGGVVNKSDGESTRDVKNGLSHEKSQAKVDVDQRESGFSVGDIVWAIINKKQKQIWWPGIVWNASDAPHNAANGPAREDDVCVRCFGNGDYIWCSLYDVKPFVGHFDWLANQSTAKKFHIALENALTELGHCAKTEFTCSCSSTVKMGKTGQLGDLSVARFEPASFLDYIKDLGKGNAMSDKVDYVVKQSCLSVYYRSLGHLQIPRDQLEPTQEKYGYFGDESNADVNKGVDLKKPRKKWCRKNKVVQANLCSSDVRSQLQFAAQDCVFQCESKNFDSVKQFVSGYRKWAFNDSPSETPVVKVRKKKDKPVIPPAFGKNLNHGSLFLDFQNLGSFNLEAQSMANTRTQWPPNQGTIFNYGYPLMTQPQPCKLEPTWSADISTRPNVSHMEGLYQAPVHNFTNEFGSTPPYFTGYHRQPQVGVVPNGLGHTPKKRGKKRKNIDLQTKPGSNFQADPGSTINLQTKPGSNFQADPGSTIDLQANRSSTIDLQANPGLTIDLQAKPGLTIDLQANPGSNIFPNLNENMSGLKKQKRVERSKEVGVQCIDLSYNKVQQDDLEVKGTAFLLKFSPDYPLPSIQDLNSVFSKFGELIESETQVWIENLSGQVVFLDSSSAGGAFWGLQNDKPFGSVLVNYKIQHLAGSESLVPFKTPLKSPSGPKPIDSNAFIGPTMIPDLNTNSTEVQIIKRSNTIEEIRLPSNDNYLSQVRQGSDDVTGTALLLKFSPNYPLPSFQDLTSIFCKYGELNEFETRVSSQDFTGQVVFVSASTAGDAIHRLEKDSPFGPALLSYRVHQLYSGQSAVRAKNPINVEMMKPPQDLGVLKKNLEMMNLMLEKSGSGLSPEMRGKLESEIKGLMNRVSAMDGSSSSSCL